MAGFSFESVGVAPVNPTGGGFSFAALAPERDPAVVQNIAQAFYHGLQASSGGLVARGKLPDQELAPDAPWYQRAAAGFGGLAGDAPAMVVGAAGGFAVGGAVSGPAAPVVAPIGAAAGSFAAPMAIREALMKAYNYEHAVSWADAMDLAKSAMWGAAKGGTIGAATGGAGAVVGRTVGSALAPGVGTAMSAQVANRVTGTAMLASELTTLSTTAAAFEGRMPSAQDFMDNAILLVGMKGAIGTAKAMRGIFAETGKLPSEVAADARADPALKAALETGKAGELPKQYEPLALEQRVEAALATDTRPEIIRKLISSDGGLAKFTDPESTPVKMEYIADIETARVVVKAIAGEYDAEVAKQTRGKVPNTQTMAEGVKLLLGGEVEGRLPGQEITTGEVAARALLVRASANDAKAQIEAFAAKGEGRTTMEERISMHAAIERTAMLYAELRGVGAEAGRAVQMFNAFKRDPSLLGDADAFLKVAERKGTWQDLNAMVKTFTDPHQMAKFAETYVKAKTFAKVVEAWRAGLFSGPLTWEANIMGNVAKWAMDVIKAPISASLFALDRAAHGDPLKLSQFRARALAPLYGLQLAVLDGIHLAARGQDILKELGAIEGAKKIAGNVMDVASRSDERVDLYKRANDPHAENIVERGTAHFSGFAFGMLKMQDLPFRTIGERSEAYVRAVDRATEEWTPSTREWREAVVKYTNDPEAGLLPEAAAKITKQIADAGSEAVFSQRLGPRTERVSAAISGTAWEFLFPARRTPINLLDWAVQHTPGMNLLSSRWREDFAAGGERKAAATARVVVGAGLAATAYGMAAEGLITGGNLADKEAAGTRAGAGIQNYSIKIGDTYHSMQRLEPVAKVMMLAADLVELMNSPSIGPEDRGKMAQMLILAFANSTISTTYLSGLANAMKAALDPARYAEPLFESYASTVVPKIVGQTVALVDPYKREVDGAIEAIQAQLPYFREQLMPKRDVWGEDMKNEKLLGVMPVQVTTAEEDKVKTEAARLWLAIADAPKYAEEKGPLSARDKRVKFTEEQRNVFKEVSGTKALEILGPIVNSEKWDRLPAFVQVAIYKDVLQNTRKQGIYAALPADAAARVVLREQIAEKIKGQVLEAQGAPSGGRTFSYSSDGKREDTSPRRLKYNSKGERE